ncbi:MAG: Nif3-like dinuclear metal center hexameric protein [Thioalkalispiraceae bacterium]
MVNLNELVRHCDDLLEVDRFHDYCPNGLQVQGREQVKTIVSGVTACQALIDAAIEQQADALLVHHGYFWKGEDARIVGMKRRRIQSLLTADISLLAYHLPLDAHPLLGNNAQLADKLGITIEGQFGREQPAIGLYGSLSSAISVADFLAIVRERLGREPLHIPGEIKQIQRIAWCTGGAQSYIEQAVDLGVDLYLSGEISEQTTHIARETGTHYVAAGHHATERYGVQALGEHLSGHFGINHFYIDIDNPV